MSPSASTRRPENLPLIFQEVFTAIERLRSNRQGVTDSQSSVITPRSAQDSRQPGAGRRLPIRRRQGRHLRHSRVPGRIRSQFAEPVFTDWLSKPLQEELFGTHIAGEVFFQHLQQLLGRNDSADLADVLEVHYLCLLLGFGGRYSAGNRGELAQVMSLTAEKIRRVRGQFGPLSPGWMLPEETVRSRADPLVRKLGWLALACAILMLLLFGGYKLTLGSGVSDVQAIATPAR